MKTLEEVSRAACAVGVDVHAWPRQEARAYINGVLAKFKPAKVSGHLFVGGNALQLPLDPWEFEFSNLLPIFLAQQGPERDLVVEFSQGTELCRVMEESWGVEHFASNPLADYLIAVNWYAVEVTGPARNAFEHWAPLL